MVALFLTNYLNDISCFISFNLLIENSFSIYIITCISVMFICLVCFCALLLRAPIDNRQLFASEGATVSGIN